MPMGGLAYRTVGVPSGHLQGAPRIHEKLNDIRRRDDFEARVHLLGRQTVVNHARAADGDATTFFEVLGQQVCHGLERLADRHARRGPGLAELDGFDHEDDGGRVAFEQGVERHGEGHGDLVRIACAVEDSRDEISGLHVQLLVGMGVERGWFADEVVEAACKVLMPKPSTVGLHP